MISQFTLAEFQIKISLQRGQLSFSAQDAVVLLKGSYMYDSLPDRAKGLFDTLDDLFEYMKNAKGTMLSIEKSMLCVSVPVAASKKEFQLALESYSVGANANQKDAEIMRLQQTIAQLEAKLQAVTSQKQEMERKYQMQIKAQEQFIYTHLQRQQSSEKQNNSIINLSAKYPTNRKNLKRVFQSKATKVDFDSQGLKLEGIQELITYNWSHIQILDLRGNSIGNQGLNRLTFIGWPNLSQLWLGNNQIYKIFINAQNIRNLNGLHLGANYIHQLPTNIVELTQLTQIALNDNQFKVFPKELLKLPCLIKVWIDKNNIANIEADVSYLALKKRIYFQNGIKQNSDQ